MLPPDHRRAGESDAVAATVTTLDPDARFDVSGPEALAGIESFEGAVVVDLDETLLLANSTSLFLDSIRPAWLVYLVVKLADVLARLLPSRAVRDRDALRVSAVLRLLPWSRSSWSRRVPSLVAPLLNRPLLAAIQAVERPVVVSTKGFGPIVGPIVDQTRLAPAGVVSMDPRSAEDRDGVKLRATVEALAPLTLGESLVVTDSMDDERLLDASARPMRVEWPMPRAEALFANL